MIWKPGAQIWKTASIWNFSTKIFQRYFSFDEELGE